MIGHFLGASRSFALGAPSRGRLRPLPGAWPGELSAARLGSANGFSSSGSGSSSSSSGSPPPGDGGVKTRFQRYMPRHRPYRLPRWVAPDDDDAMGSGSGTHPSSDREPLDYDAKRQASMDPVGVRAQPRRLSALRRSCTLRERGVVGHVVSVLLLAGSLRSSRATPTRCSLSPMRGLCHRV